MVISLLSKESHHPGQILPKIFGALHDGVLGLLKDEFEFEPECFFIMLEHFLLGFFDILMVQQIEFVLIVESPPSVNVADCSFYHFNYE